MDAVSPKRRLTTSATRCESAGLPANGVTEATARLGARSGHVRRRADRCRRRGAGRSGGHGGSFDRRCCRAPPRIRGRLARQGGRPRPSPRRGGVACWGRAMTEWSFGSAIYGGAWATPEMRALFADVPRTRRWLDLLALLAEVQAEHGIIPRRRAQDIRATCRSIEVDADFLAECREGYEATSHSTSGLIAAVARRCSGTGGEWFYFGATVQDITDTWLMLTLREARRILIADLDRAMSVATEDLCRRHRDTVMAGRTHGQQGLPITFGFKAAGWLAELRRHRRRFDEAAQRMDVGQLCGGVGSLSAMGPKALAVQERFLERLGSARARHVVDGEPRHSRRMGASPRALHRHGRPDRP